MSSKSRKNRPQSSAPFNSLTPPANKPLLRSPPQGEESRRLLEISGQRTTSFSGPLPPPQALREYDQIVPGLATRIVAQAERQTEHRISLEAKVVGLATTFIYGTAARKMERTEKAKLMAGQK